MSAIGIGISPIFGAEVPGWWISTGLKALAGGPLAMYVRESIVSNALWRDVSGNNFHATATGAGLPTVTATGMDFDGTSDFMTIAGLSSVSTDYTAVFVIEPDTVSGTQTLLGCNAPDAFHAVVSGSVGLHDGTGNRAGMVSTARLQLLVIRAKAAGTTIDFYRDGEKLATSTSYDGTFSFGTPVLGAAHGGASGWFDGEIRFAALWASSLSDANVTTLESILMTRFAVTFTPLSVANLEFWYTIAAAYMTVSGGNVTQLTDRSGNARHLTVPGVKNPPAWNAVDLSIDFDAANTEALQRATWTRVQPCTNICDVLAGGTTNAAIFDGTAINTALAYVDVNDNFRVNAGAAFSHLTSVTTQWNRLRVTFSGASSAIAINNGAATTNNAGANNAGGLTLGAVGNLATHGSPRFRRQFMGYARALSALEYTALDALNQVAA